MVARCFTVLGATEKGHPIRQEKKEEKKGKKKKTKEKTDGHPIRQEKRHPIRQKNLRYGTPNARRGGAVGTMLSC